jgi:hypothetical protein
MRMGVTVSRTGRVELHGPVRPLQILCNFCRLWREASLKGSPHKESFVIFVFFVAGLCVLCG